MTTRDRVALSLTIETGEYIARRSEGLPKRAPMRPAGVRKMRQSRKRRKGNLR
jgi:hypothetical protein